MPERDQWANWKDHPCTQAMIKLLKEDREVGFEELSFGGSDDALILLGVKIGKLNALTSMINYGFIPEEDANDRQS
jgi:hypothetical protein